MILFKEFMQEGVIDSYLGTKLMVTDHYYDQLKLRNNDPAVLKDIFKNAVDHLKKNDHDGQISFLFYSKKHNQAIAFKHQCNPNTPKDKRKHLLATTIFPKGDKHPNPSTTLVTVEGFSSEFLEYIDLFIPEDVRVEYPLSEVMAEGVEFFFLHGRLENIPFNEFVEVE
jgi:hypothetical protein